MFLHEMQVCGFGGVCAGCLTQSVHSCSSVGVSVSQPSDMSGAKATCVFEYLQFSVVLEQEDSANNSGVSGRQMQETHNSGEEEDPRSEMCWCSAWQDGNTWWCCSCGRGTELSHCAPLAFSPSLSASVSLCPPPPALVQQSGPNDWGCF